MNYMLLVYAEEPPVHTTELVPSPGCDGMVDRLQASGRYVASGILHSTLTSTSLRVREGRRLVTDGPFAETREQLAGYLLVEAANLDEALAIAAEHPVAKFGTIEVRPVHFSYDWTPVESAPIVTTTETPFVFSRIFDAPRDLVWRSWTEAEQLGQWWGPKGLGTEVHEFDLRPGGVFRYAMVPPEGEPTFGKFTFREIAQTERLVFTNGFANEAGDYERAPFGFEWPLEILNTVTFEDVDGGTRVTLSGIPVDPTESERGSFAKMHDSMNGGFGGTFDRLADLLAASKAADEAAMGAGW